MTDFGSHYRGRALPLVLVLCCLILLGPRSAQALDLDAWSAWNDAAPNQLPEASWQRYATPEEAGWSAAGLADAAGFAEENGSAAGFVTFNGAMLTEWGAPARRFKCHSVRKSLLSALYGMAVAEGSIDPEATLAAIGLDDTTPLTETEKQAKISDLLKARSGIYLPAAYETARMRRMRPERGSHAPGTHWYYNNWDFNALGAIYNMQTGRDLFRDFEARLARPLQMQDFDLSHTYYHLEARHSRFPAYPFRMSARDLARFGLLFLNEGRWRDAQLVPAGWVAESTRAWSETARGGGYGYMWWIYARTLREMGAYAAFGYGGQSVIVVPAARLVMVHRANTYDGKHLSQDLIAQILIRVLKARQGPPAAAPRLVAVPERPAREPAISLTPAERAALAGSYRSRRIASRIVDTGSGLELTDPRRGRFRLLPLTPTRVLIEDYEWEAEFVTDNDGAVTALQIEGASNARYVLKRVAD